MWQVDNDRYALWHLEHELGQKPLDRLLNSVTVSDRSPTIVRPFIGSLAGMANRLAHWLRNRRNGASDQPPTPDGKALESQGNPFYTPRH